MLKRYWIGSLAVWLAMGSWTAQAQELFSRPAALEPDIAFWTRVYTEIDTSSGFIHDSRYLNVVYRTVRFARGASGRDRNRVLRTAYDELNEILDRLASGKRDGLTAAEQLVLDAWPADVSDVELRAAKERLRFQLGQADRFRSGLVRSGTWRDYIETVLERRGLPLELAALPHVESSFDPTAYSKVGAAGMWQFTRSTGLRYMRIDHIVDERRDPFLSTIAAARLLSNNYDVLESWPLAITAYNHGVSGMRQAVQQQKTTDIETIVRNYNGRTFGFASRNFYVAFLAALDVDRDPERYFGPIRKSSPANSVTVTVPDYVAVNALAESLDIDARQLRAWNPALTDAVWSGDKFVPSGFELRLPVMLGADPAVRLSAIPATARFTDQMPDIFHRVGRGDTISQIADRYGVSITSLVELNGLRSRNFIRAGQVLRLPGNGSTTPVTLAQLDEPPGDVATYVVRSGDSIAEIARRFRVSEDDLLARNGIVDRNRIYAGQELRIAAELEPAEDARIVASVDRAPDPAPDDLLALADVAEVTRTLPQLSMTDATNISLSRAEEQRLLTAEAAVAMLTDRGPAAATETTDTGVISSDFNARASTISEPLTASVSAIPVGAAEEILQPAVVSFGEADHTSPESNVLSSEQAELAADPSDYLVAADGTIEVQALETLGHYADWLGLKTQRLRDINGLPYGRAVVIGERLELEFDTVDAATFERRRIAYQEGTQEAFFRANQITDTVDHVVQPGESLWLLALRRYRVPVWLVRQFNPDLNLDQVNPGVIVKFPELRPIVSAESPAQAANDVE